MAQLESLQKDIKAAGATLAYIAAQKRAGFFNPAKYLAKNPVTFPFLLDEDRQVTKAYGVYHHIGLDAYDIARPASFVMARDGTIRWIYVGQGQADRSPTDDLLKAARAAQI